MESETRLDSAVFQLTPTRTRYGLVISADGKTEKIASGLLDPFLAHLKEARDQVARGGYSIILQPNHPKDTMWFTKGTMERFVRFVSTPEVLERVNTIECEGLQIEEAIAIQNNDNLRLSNVKDIQKKVKVYRTRSLESTKGSKPLVEVDVEKAVLIYEEENPRFHILRVLETRRSILQKEQYMAFARAVAAGFDMDHMAHLTSFAACFGALRLMDACLGFMVLWKVKHETGKWLEAEAAESMSKRPDYPPMNTSNIMPAETKVHNKLKEECSESYRKFEIDSNRKVNNAVSGAMDFHKKGEERHLSHQELGQSQFQHPKFCQSLHSLPAFQAYPMHQSGGIQLFQPSYSQMEDPRSNTTQTIGIKRPPMDSKEVITEAGSCGLGASHRAHEGSKFEKGCSQDLERSKADQSSKKQSSMVIIHNINYITSKRRVNTSDGGLQLEFDPEVDNDAEYVQDDIQQMKQKKSMRSSKSKGSPARASDTCSSHDKASIVSGQEDGGGHWQAFQNCLLRHNNEGKYSTVEGILAPEKDVQKRRQQNKMELDPIVPQGQDPGTVQKRWMNDIHRIRRNETHLLQASNDELISQTGIISSNSDPSTGNGFERATNGLDRSSLHNLTDDSFIVPVRPSSQDQAGMDSRTATEMCAKLPSRSQKTHNFSNKVRKQLSYEPDDLSLIPMRGTEKKSVNYDPVVDYETRFRDAARIQNTHTVHSVPGIKEVSKKSKVMHPEKMKMKPATEKGELSKSKPSNEAQARAERPRSFKVDPQKMKKNREEEEVKRLETLKRERQKRITARSSSGPAQSALSSQTRPQKQQTKIDPVLYKSSKFSDSEPAKWSPLQRFHTRTASLGSKAPQEITKPNRLTSSDHIAVTRSSRSAPSLSELKKENVLMNPEPSVAEAHVRRLPDPKPNNKPHISFAELQNTDSVKPELKVATAQIRRQSDPKTSHTHHISSKKSRRADPVTKPKAFDVPEVKKISAIMNHDRSKAATLPGLKTRSLKGPPNIIANKLLKKVVEQKAAEKSSVYLKSNEVQRRNENTSNETNGEDKEIIDKTVVLENDVPLIPVVNVSEERMDRRKRSYNEHKVGDTELVTEYVGVHAPASPVIMGEVRGGSTKYQSTEIPFAQKVMKDYAVVELAKCSSTDFAAKLYHPPCVQLPSLEKPCASNSVGTSTPLTGSEIAVKSTATVKVHVIDSSDLSSPGKNPRAQEQSQEKESSKGFKRLLRFGRKSHNSAVDMRNVESCRLSINNIRTGRHAANTVSSNEVHTLKALLSQGETTRTGEATRTGGTAQKASRPFSLSSTFRSKIEKKLRT